jgi:hypothetical protein
MCSWLNPGIILEGLRKTTKNLSQDSIFPGRDSNQARPEYKSTELPLYQGRAIAQAVSRWLPTAAVRV